jgi:dsDNA-specific endonuclease/ATPase MutS2
MTALTFAQKENIGLQYVLDAMQPCSPYGRRLLQALKPLGPESRQELQRQLDNVQKLLCLEDRGRQLQPLLRVLMGMKMVRPAVEKCRETQLNEIELFEIKRFLLQSEEIFAIFSQLQPQLRLEGISLQDTRQALDVLDPEGNRVATFFVPDTASGELAAVRREKRTLEMAIRQEPTQALLLQRSEIAGREAVEEQRIYGLLSEKLRPHLSAMLANMDAIADLDLTAEKARIAKLWGGVKPELTENTLSMTDMRNPRIAAALESQNRRFTPVSIAMPRGVTVITGANMGGKSVALKTLALNIVLVHCGFFPFAAGAAVPLFDGVHMISEDLESVDRGLSSFGGEMVRFRDVLQQLPEGFHFVLLDEFARGTNPKEGAAIVRSVTRYLNGYNAMTVLATHFDHVAQLANAHYQVAGLKDVDWQALACEIAQDDGQSGAQRIARHMNYGLFRVDGGQSCPRDALNICRLLGMPEEIMQEAEKTVADSEKIC